MTLLSSIFPLNCPCRRLPAALAALAVMSLANAAFATCGDYLVHSGMPEPESSIPQTGPQETEPAPLPTRPCDGPHCRQAPSLPIAPAAPLTWSTQSDHHAIVVASNTDRPGFAKRRPNDGDADERPGYRDGIERPPRAL